MSDHNPVPIIWVAVPFSENELKQLRRLQHVTGEGTLWAAVRSAMVKPFDRRQLAGLQEKPVNLRSKRAVHTLIAPNREITGEQPWHLDPRWEQQTPPGPQ